MHSTTKAETPAAQGSQDEQAEQTEPVEQPS